MESIRSSYNSCSVGFAGSPKSRKDSAVLRYSVTLCGIVPISIYAPHVGCDSTNAIITPQYQNFNPRTPCGVRQVYPLSKGANTVEVMVLDAAGLPADSALIEEVQNYIDPGSSGNGSGVAPIGAHCYITAPTKKTIDVSVTVSALPDFDKDTIQASVEEQLSVYLSEICLKQDYVSYGKVYAYIGVADGIKDFSDLKLNGTTGNVSVPDKSVAVLGKVTITYAA